jgi:hypothetical protein
VVMLLGRPEMADGCYIFDLAAGCHQL